jgi:hypothetical protein
MLRILLYVAALVALFGGAIVYGGNAIGAWDPLPPAPQPPPAVKLGDTKSNSKQPDEQPATKPPAQAPRLTAAQKVWVRKANALCRESKGEVQAVISQGDASTPPGLLELFGRVRTVNAELNDRFLALGAPAGFKDDIARVRGLFAKEERYFDAMYRALEQHDTKTFYALSDRVTEVALDETDIIANLGAYGCDISLSSAFS